MQVRCLASAGGSSGRAVFSGVGWSGDEDGEQRREFFLRQSCKAFIHSSQCLQGRREGHRVGLTKHGGQLRG